MLEITIISSDEDIASQTIRKQLLKNYEFIETALTERFTPKENCAPNCERNSNWNSDVVNTIYTFCPHTNLKFTLVRVNLRMIRLDEFLTREELHGDLVVFASRHSSKTGKASLLCHTPGNWKDNKYGGQPSTIAKGSALLMHYYYKKLLEKAQHTGLNSYYRTGSYPSWTHRI